jgi:hypothetical protein
MDSLSILHISHLLINTIFFFFKLSSVRILLRTADQTKKATLDRALERQMLFQGKGQLALDAYKPYSYVGVSGSGDEINHLSLAVRGWVVF